MAPSLNSIAPFVGTGVELIEPGGGFVTGIDGIRLLYSADWTPSLGNDLDDPTYPATYVWALNEASGTTLVESRVGGGTHDLLASGGSSNHFVGQTASGIYDGVDLSSRKCLETTPGSTTSDRFAVASSALNSSVGSIAVRVRIRVPICNNNNRALLGTKGATGWTIYTNSDGSVRGSLYDGITNKVTAPGAYIDDGAWHEVELIIDWTLNEMRLRVDGVAATPESISTVVKANTGGSAFSIGGAPSVVADANFQIERLLGWEAGDGAESIDATAWTNVSKLGARPVGLNSGSFLDTLPAYSGVVPVPCDAGSDGLWYLASGDKSTDDYPIGYSALLETRGAPNGFGRWHNPERTDLVTESERLENATWSTGTATVSASAADLIDSKVGFRTARKVTATGVNDFIGIPVTLTAGSYYSVYAYIAGNGGTVTGRIVLWDVTAAAEQDSVVFSVSDGVLSHVGKIMRADLVNTAHEVRIEIDNNTEAVNVCHVACSGPRSSTGTCDTLPMLTFGASATVADTSTQAAALPTSGWTEVSGSLEVYAITESISQTTSGVLSTSNSTVSTLSRYTQNDFRLNTLAGSGVNFRLLQEDGSTNAVNITAGAADATAGFRAYVEWNSKIPLNGTNYGRLATTHSGGTTDDYSGTSAWDPENPPNPPGVSGQQITRAIGSVASSSPAGSFGLLGYTRGWSKNGGLSG